MRPGHRILRSMFAAGIMDSPSLARSVVDPFREQDDASHIAEESIVLLKNKDSTLPLKSGITVAVIGGHADLGVLLGGGSAQVDAPAATV